MADHNKPTNTSLYSNYTSELNGRFVDITVGLDPASTTATNIPDKAIRFNSANSRWEKYDLATTTWGVLDTGYEIDLAGSRKLTANSSDAAFTITQTGTGNAFVVEDAASPDATPFVIDNVGRVINGYTTSLSFSTVIPNLQNVGNGVSSAAMMLSCFNSDGGTRSDLYFAKSNTSTIGNFSQVSSGTSLGQMRFLGADNTGFIEAAKIQSSVDVTPGSGDMPGRLMFFTTPSGSATPVERMRITNAGDIGIGLTPTAKLDILANTTSDAVRITQTGTGNAFVVEDSTSPDASPFVIDAVGRVVVGTPTAISVAGTTPQFQVMGTSFGTSASFNARYSANAGGVPMIFAKSRNATIGSHTIVGNGEEIGNIFYYGSDGTNFVEAARIAAQVDGTPGTNDMPGRLAFFTTPDGSASPVERMRIDNQGNVAIGGTPTAATLLYSTKRQSGATTAYGVYLNTSTESDVTANVIGFRSRWTLDQTTSLTTLVHYEAGGQGTFAVQPTNQFGFRVNNLTGAVNNYSFYADLASATGRWNFYANGTAPNYFEGDVRSNTVLTQSTSPVNLNTSSTLSVSSLLGGIRTGTPTANINYTLPTGTNMDAGFQDLQTNQTIEWSVINLAAATHVITVVANTGHTVVGNMAVAANSSARFMTRKTAANTFVTYRGA
jgi:hypothetical protein